MYSNFGASLPGQTVFVMKHHWKALGGLVVLLPVGFLMPSTRARDAFVIAADIAALHLALADLTFFLGPLYTMAFFH